MSELTPNTIHTGDLFNVVPTLPVESVHAVVTDPPYGLAFMGRDWDDFEPKEYQEWCEDWAREVRRVLKPGGHMLAFSGNRTHHRAFTGFEDAGFEIRDTVTWHYASGFPKGLNVSKAIDKRADADREVVGDYEAFDDADRDPETWSGKKLGGKYGDGEEREYQYNESGSGVGSKVTAPATEAAKKWHGWKTALKPATEFVVVARKPLSEGSVAENIQTHGTGALNIDGCRIQTDDDLSADNSGGFASGIYSNENKANPREPTETEFETPDSKGRFPSNVVFNHDVAAVLDREVGELDGRSGDTSDGFSGDTYGSNAGDYDGEGHTFDANSGGPSRYFYTSKATRAERTLDGKIANAHPTVKPSDLMEWLVTLVTAEGQTVIDPFAGSGTTCRAAKDCGREFVGIEQQAQWADVARVRCGLSPDDPSHVRDDDAQTGLESYGDN